MTKAGIVVPLHLIKLCVGATSIADLKARTATRVASGVAGDAVHVTRMVPSRAADLLAGGSLFWVIAGQIAARQVLRDIQPFTDDLGTRRCRLVLDEAIVPVSPRPQRVFQGWRYLDDADCPSDLSRADGTGDMPEALRRELRGLCLL